MIGGVGAFVSDSLSAVKRDDLELINDIQDYSAEYMFLDLIKNNSHYLIGCFYRHPSGNISEFCMGLENLF